MLPYKQQNPLFGGFVSLYYTTGQHVRSSWVNKPDDYKYYQFIFDELDTVKEKNKEGTRSSLDYADSAISLILSVTGFGIFFLGMTLQIILSQ